jgi:hypothetical protein
MLHGAWSIELFPLIPYTPYTLISIYFNQFLFISICFYLFQSISTYFQKSQLISIYIPFYLIPSPSSSLLPSFHFATYTK